MAYGNLIYHSIRLAEQAVGRRREANRRSRPVPGDNPLGLSEETVDALSAAMDRVVADAAADRTQALRTWGEHAFVMAMPDNDPDYEATRERMRLPGGRTAWLCLTCKRENDAVIHRPTWAKR